MVMRFGDAGTSVVQFSDGSTKYCYEMNCDYYWAINGHDVAGANVRELERVFYNPGKFTVSVKVCWEDVCSAAGVSVVIK